VLPVTKALAGMSRWGRSSVTADTSERSGPGEVPTPGRPGLPGARLSCLGAVWAVALAWCLVDLLTKEWALRTLWAGEKEVIPGVLWFNLVRNPGAAFGLLPQGQPFFIATAVLLIGVGVWAPLAVGGRGFGPGHLGLGLLVGGGLGNLVDRAFREGLVVDFIDFRVWPVFNLADTGIVVGTCLVLFYLLRSLVRPTRSDA